MNRRSYRGLMSLPAWGLYDSTGALAATVRAADAYAARVVFRTHELGDIGPGPHRVRRVA